MWFTFLECGFKASKIKNSLTKFAHAVSLIPPDVFPQVSDVISAASTSDTPYDDLKTALLQDLQPFIATRLKELLSKEELGDEKPTELLRHMKQLLGDKYHSFDTDLFKQLFYQCLPPAIQRFLFSAKDSLQLDAIAKLADDFMATIPTPHSSSVFSVTTQDNTQIAELTKLVSQLTAEVTSLKKQFQDRQRSRSSTPQHRQRRPQSRSPGLFWYHDKFGDRASKCAAPCTYKASNFKGEY